MAYLYSSACLYNLFHSKEVLDSVAVYFSSRIYFFSFPQKKIDLLIPIF